MPYTPRPMESRPLIDWESRYLELERRYFELEKKGRIPIFWVAA
jgi:hypothetical protein